MAALPAGPPGPGDRAPGFELPNQYGELLSLASFAGHPVLLVFYPFAFSRVCSGELAELQRLLPDFEAAGASVLAISCDAKYSLRAWAQEQGWSLDLLSDFWPHGQVAQRYGAFDSSRGRATRASFLIGPDGTVRRSFRSALSEPRDPADYLRALGDLAAAGRS